MIRESLFSLQFLKKEAFHGSYRKMRYRLVKKEDVLEVCVFPGPYGFEHTPEEQKEYRTFDFSEEGYEEAKDWLEAQYPKRDWEALDKANW